MSRAKIKGRKPSTWTFNFQTYKTHQVVDEETGETRTEHILDDDGNKISETPLVEPILVYPNPHLVRPCRPVDVVDEEVRMVLVQLEATREAAEGDGMAAPQIGFDIRAIVVKLADDTALGMVNPVITHQAGNQSSTESCFSLPGLKGKVDRALVASVGYKDIDGVDQVRVFEARAAAVVQHEMDHLDGILFVDRMGLSRVAKRHFLAGIPVFLRAVTRGDEARVDRMIGPDSR